MNVYILELYGSVACTPEPVRIDFDRASLDRESLLPRLEELGRELTAELDRHAEDHQSGYNEECTYRDFDLDSRPEWAISSYVLF